MEIHFLGTGAANPGPTRGASSLVIQLPTGSCWMFDCGEGTQTQLMKSLIKPGKLDKIFITHLHGDHVFGLPGLLCTISLNSPDQRSAIHVYGPKGLSKYLTTTLTLSGSQLTFPCVIHELCQSGRGFSIIHCQRLVPLLAETGIFLGHPKHANRIVTVKCVFWCH